MEHISNEQKARELMKDGDVFTRGDVYAFVDEVAKWKDEQVKQTLVAMFKEAGNETAALSAIMCLYQRLFGTDMSDFEELAFGENEK